MLGKWLARDPKLLIIDEPTRGIDVGTKAEVHRILDGLVADGMAVLMISSELPEVLGMADRVLVLREGRLTAELSRGRGRRGLDHARGHRRRTSGIVGMSATAAAPPAAGPARRLRGPAAGPRARHRASLIVAGRSSSPTINNHALRRRATASQQLLTGAALIALLGVGETLVIVTRNVDLSVGSVLGLSAYVVGDLFKYHHIPVWSGFVVGIAGRRRRRRGQRLHRHGAAGAEPGRHPRHALRRSAASTA